MSLFCNALRASAPRLTYTFRQQLKDSHLVSSSLCQRRRLLTFSGTNGAEGEIDDSGDYEVILPPEPPVWGVSHIPLRDVPAFIPRPPYAIPGRVVSDSDRYFGDPYDGDGRIEPGSENERRLRRAGTLAKRVLKKAGELIRVGVTTNEIDAALHDFIVANNAYPSPLRYAGFPKSCCTSINNIVVHGIPDDRKLVDGDIVNIDVTIFSEGFHGDTSQTFLVGSVVCNHFDYGDNTLTQRSSWQDRLGRELVQSASEALEAGIRACGPGVPFKAVGAAIHAFAEARNFSVSDQFTGHGIGTVFHRTPWILHHRNDEPGTMLPGHCFTIEPALAIGRDPRAWIFPDGWTASTTVGPRYQIYLQDGDIEVGFEKNGCRSAQAEHMVLITETGADVLTR